MAAEPLEQSTWIDEPPPALLPGILITVPGIPVPQGSLRTFSRNGRSWATSDNPRTRPWKAAVTAEVARAVEELGLATPAFDRRPVLVTVTFLLPRPQSHYGKRGLLPSAPKFPTTKPDEDKLERAVLDAMTGIVWRDDAQVVGITSRKRFPEEGSPLETTIYAEVAL